MENHNKVSQEKASSQEFLSNNENLSPCAGELMVAIRPGSASYSHINNSPLNTKMNISALNTKANVNEEKLVISRTVVSPVKRSFNNVDILTLEAPLAKRSSTPESFQSSDSANSVFRSLSQSVGSSQLQSAINRVKTNLSQSCFADLRANKVTDIDSDLTCLNWLQEGDLLNGFSPGSSKTTSDINKEELESKNGNQQNTGPPDPTLNSINEVDKTLRKPAYSFSTLIFMAIENAKGKRLPVKDIYQWIQDNFPYFQKAPIGWKNSVRHNLSLNKSFKKVEKEKCIGKGSLWTIDHEARAGLVQQLRKTTTYHSYPYSKSPYHHSCNKYFAKDKATYKRDFHGRFIANHDDAEFDVAATMCSMSSPFPGKERRNCTNDNATSVELLRIWRTYIEPYDEGCSMSRGSSPENDVDNKFQPIKGKYSIENFLDEVQNKLSFNSNRRSKTGLNTSMDEDYEFYNSDDDSDDEDDEMSQNMKRLVDKERDDSLADSGYSEEGSLKSSTMLDHSYSKSLNSLVRPHSKRESKGVAALLHLANAATKELEILNKKESPDHSYAFPPKDNEGGMLDLENMSKYAENNILSSSNTPKLGQVNV